jgi:uncharacterized protein
MRSVPQPLAFDWDEGNTLKNLIKHNVTIQEAEEMFSNEPLTVVDDSLHSVKEIRFHALGKTKVNRKLFAAFTVRDNKVRIISVRDMKRKERLAYEKLESNS